MALHGMCEIELRDEQGNIVQKTKDKNMVTNAFSNMINTDFRKMTILFGTDYIKNNYLSFFPIISKMIGGVYLFNEVQNENIDNIVPNFTKLVGCASLSKSVINNIYSGIFNFNESQIIYNESGNIIGAKFVFDFPTDRSNGTIKSVSLCSDVGARYINRYVGYAGLIRSDYHLNLIDPIKQIDKNDQSDIEVQFDTFSGSLGNIITMTENGEIIFLSNIDYTSKTIKLTKYKLKESIGINDLFISRISQYLDINSLDIIVENIIDVSDIIIVNNGIGSSYWSTTVRSATFYYNNYIYITQAYGDKIKVKKIDTDNFAIVETIDRTFEQGHINEGYYHKYNMTSGYATCNSLCIYKNYYIVQRCIKDTDYQSILFLDKNSLAIVKEIKFYNHATYYGITHPLLFGYMEDYLIVTFSYYYSLNESNQVKYFIDGELNVYEDIYKQQQSAVLPISQSLFKYPITLCRNTVFAGMWYPNTISYALSLSLYPKFTIDNLSTPVTKTASQTMKVIYTIKDAEQQPAQ